MKNKTIHLKHNKTYSIQQHKTKKNNTNKYKTRIVSNNSSNEMPNQVYTMDDYQSNDGMLTSIWGPTMWVYLHTMSFNYPINPTLNDKKHYRDFILNLQNTLPCGKCRKNLRENFKKLPLLHSNMKSRHTFSLYIYKLHELINTMLNKTSGLTYENVRERYEHFRARCLTNRVNLHPSIQSKPIGENGCTEPLYGEKTKCILKIVPQKLKCNTLQIDKKCLKYKNNPEHIV